jgi:hypothetical protein
VSEWVSCARRWRGRKTLLTRAGCSCCPSASQRGACHSLTHSLILPLNQLNPLNQLTHSLILPLTHLTTQPTHSLTHSTSHSLNRSLTTSLSYHFTYPLTHSLFHPLFHYFIQPLTHLLTHPPTHSHTHTHTHTHTHCRTLTHCLMEWGSSEAIPSNPHLIFAGTPSSRHTSASSLQSTMWVKQCTTRRSVVLDSSLSVDIHVMMWWCDVM